MEKDFEKDLMSGLAMSIATGKKINLFDFANHFDNTLDVSKHSGLLVQIKAPEAIMTTFIGKDPVILITSDFLNKRLNSENKFLDGWKSAFNKPFIRKETHYDTGVANNERNQAYMALLINELFTTGFVKRTCKSVAEDLSQQGVSGIELKVLLKGASLQLTQALAVSARVAHISMQDNDSIIFSIHFDAEKFNSCQNVVEFISTSDILPFQIAMCGYVDARQEELIKSIPFDRLDTFNLEGKNSDEPCDCPTCKMEQELKNMGINFSSDEN